MANKLGSKLAKVVRIAVPAIAIALGAPQTLIAQARASVQATATVVSAVPQQEVIATAETYVNRLQTSTTATAESRRNALGGLVQLRADTVAERAIPATRVTLEYAAN